MVDSRQKLGIGVVGLGVGEQHALAYAGHDGCELRWLYDIDETQAKDARKRIGQGEIAESFEQILEDDNVAAVSIASYDHLHFGQVTAALAAGKHVFVEKPLCRTADELSRIKAAWAKADKPHLASNLVLRGAALYQWLAQEIEAGTFGRIYAFDGDYLYGRVEKITEGWRKDVPDYSVMEGGGVHLIDLMVGLMGERPASVATVASRIATEGSDFAYDDFMASTFTFPSGAIGRISANFGCVHRHHHVVRVFGTEATFIYDDIGPRLHRTRDENAKAETVNRAPMPPAKGVLIPAFVDAILTGADAGPAAAREFDLISILAAADAALGQGTQDIGYLT